jgi:EamA domain-containing membrane protein RarD
MQRSSRLHTFMRRDVPLAATVALAVVNGMPLTSLYDSVSYVLYLFTRGSAFIDQDVLEYLTTLVIAVMTLLLGAIPAALYERVRGLKESTPASLGVWLVATGLIALPSLASLVDRW